MYLAIPIVEKDRNSKLSEKFARAPYFALIHKEEKSVELVENSCLEAQEKVGKCVVEFLFEQHRVNTIVAFELGVKVQQIAHQNKIQLVLLNTKQHTLMELLKLLKIE